MKKLKILTLLVSLLMLQGICANAASSSSKSNSDDDYTKEEIEKFCTQYSVTCKFKETSSATGDAKSGDIISQSRPSGTTVTAGATLTITIYVKDEVEECNPNEEVCE